MDRREFNITALAAVGALAGRAVGATAPVRVNGRRIDEHLSALAAFGKNLQGGVSRIAYTEADRQGREYVTGRMRAAGLDVRMDAAGNIIGRRAGSESGLPPLWMGSHIDSVP